VRKFKFCVSPLVKRYPGADTWTVSLQWVQQQALNMDLV